MNPHPKNTPSKAIHNEVGSRGPGRAPGRAISAQVGGQAPSPAWPWPATPRAWAPGQGHLPTAGWSRLLVMRAPCLPRGEASSGSEPAASVPDGLGVGWLAQEVKCAWCPFLGRSGTSGRSSGRSISPSASTPTSSAQ